MMGGAFGRGLRSASAVLGILILVLASGCSPEPKEGPGKLRWDRAACEYCQMSIGERMHGVQVRSSFDHKLHFFDDIGCALLWIEGQRMAGKGEAEELWVRAPAGGSWVDGLGARYAPGFRTPMGYGFHAVDAGNADALDLSAVLEQVQERQRERRSK